MKKEYRSPLIAFESFALSTNVAGDCAKQMGAATLLGQGDTGCGMYGTYNDYDNNCKFYSNGTELFIDINSCDTTPESDGIDDEYYFELCYDVPTSNNKIFSS